MLLAVSATLGSLRTAQAHPGMLVRASIAKTGTQANGHSPARTVPDLTSPSLSLDGLTLAYSSDASNLVPDDTNGAADVFIRDRWGRITRGSVTRDGAQANGASYSPSLSVDGRYLAFISTATNLVSGDTNGKADVFLKHLAGGWIRRISVSNFGEEANGDSNRPRLSVFGGYLTFESTASNLALDDDNGVSDAFLYDASTRKVTRLVAPIPADSGPGELRAHTGHAEVSFDGRIVAYHRLLLREGIELPVAADVFIWDRSKDTKRRIHMNPWAGVAKRMLENPFVTADSRYVGFEAWSAITAKHTIGGNNPLGLSFDNHDALTRNPYEMRTIYLYDHQKNIQFPVSTNPAGPVANGDCGNASVNAYGTIIAFTCEASNMVAGDTNDAVDVFVKDLPGRVTARISIGADHAEGFGTSTRPSISYEGRRIAFASPVQTFVSGDTNGVEDIFLRDRRTDLVDRAPNLAKPFGGERQGLNLLEKFTYQMRASDPDKDPLRYGAISALPEGARINPVTGVFEWTPTPDQTETGGKEIDIVLWISDPGGHFDFELLQLTVRDASATSRCLALGHACY